MTRHICPNCDGTRRTTVFYGEDEFLGLCAYCDARGWVTTDELRDLMGVDEDDDLEEAA